MLTSVADLYQSDADPDQDPSVHFDADLDPTLHFDADPDQTLHFYADPDPIQLFTMIRILLRNSSK
jgi:hypothetical protein